MNWLPWRKKAVRRVPIHVVMYTRAGCHLCDVACQLLEEMRSRYVFDLEIVDVDSQAELVQRFGERVPVVAVNGKERLWGKINRVLLERSLRAASRLA